MEKIKDKKDVRVTENKMKNGRNNFFLTSNYFTDANGLKFEIKKTGIEKWIKNIWHSYILSIRDLLYIQRFEQVERERIRQGIACK